MQIASARRRPAGGVESSLLQELLRTGHDRLDRRRAVADPGEFFAGPDERLPIVLGDGDRVRGAGVDQPAVTAVRELAQRRGDGAGTGAGPQRLVQETGPIAGIPRGVSVS